MTPDEISLLSTKAQRDKARRHVRYPEALAAYKLNLSRGYPEIMASPMARDIVTRGHPQRPGLVLVKPREWSPMADAVNLDACDDLAGM